MAWTEIFKSGEEVFTPHGKGTVEQISTTGVARVNVGGQRFEVETSAMSKTSPDATEPKVGDKVRVIKENGGSPKVGDIGTISDTYGDGDTTVEVDFPGIKGWVGHIGEHLELVESGDTPAEPTPLKREDIVEGAVLRWEGHGGRRNGKVISTNRQSFEITWEGDKNPVKWQKAEVLQEKNMSLVSKPEQEEEQRQEQREEERKQRDPDTQARDTADDLYGLFNLKDKLEKKIEDSVDEELKELREEVKKNQKLEVVVNGKANVVTGRRHKQLEQLINYSALRLSPLLVGMAGTGKTHAGTQVSEALGLDFYSMSVGAQTSKSDIIGYMSANGDYVGTHFRKAYEEGGVFLMDEIDAGNANVLIQVNAALSNGLCAFPDAMVKRHDDFIFIASANTFGNGANRQYVGRNQLDAATLDRFAVIEWFIDDDLEESLAVGKNGKAWYMGVRAARDYVAEKKIRALISPRATQKGSQLLEIGQDVDEVIEATMLASVPEDKKKDVKEVATKVFEKFASKVPGQLPKEVNPPAVADLLVEF